MKMKRLLVFGLAVMFMFCGGNAFGVQPEPEEGNSFVTSSAYGVASDGDYSYSRSYCGWGNDFGVAGGTGWVSGLNISTADAAGTHMEKQFVGWKKVCYGRYCYSKPVYEWVAVPNEANASSFLFAHSPKVKAWSWAKDNGLTSKAGAGAKIEGNWYDVIVGGYGFGLEGGLETSYTEVGIGGNIWQENSANEIGYYSGTFATGRNFSELGFTAYRSVFDQGQSDQWWIFDLAGANTLMFGIEGKAIVKGKTEVSVDPYGDDRSAYARTENSAAINFPDAYVSGFVYGQGGVSAAAVNGGTMAGGNASFMYSGNQSGSGVATVNANIHTGNSGSYISVISSASSSAQ